MQGIKSMVFLDFAYVTLSPSLTFGFSVAWRDRELLPGFPGKACRDKHKLMLSSGECGTPRPRPLRPVSGHCPRPRWPWTHSELCLGVLPSRAAAHTPSRGKAEEPQGTPQTTTTSSVQSTAPSCRWLKQKFPILMKTLSHMWSIVYEFQEYLPPYTGPGTSDFSFCKGDGELPVFKKDHSLDAASKGVVILKPSSRHIPYCSNFTSKQSWNIM